MAPSFSQAGREPHPALYCPRCCWRSVTSTLHSVTGPHPSSTVSAELHGGAGGLQGPRVWAPGGGVRVRRVPTLPHGPPGAAAGTASAAQRNAAQRSALEGAGGLLRGSSRLCRSPWSVGAAALRALLLVETWLKLVPLMRYFSRRASGGRGRACRGRCAGPSPARGRPRGRPRRGCPRRSPPGWRDARARRRPCRGPRRRPGAPPPSRSRTPARRRACPGWPARD